MINKKIIFDKKNVLILGGAGFIGSHLCDELVKTSKVICIDNFVSGSEKNIDHLLSNTNFKFIKHDISEYIDLDKIPELQDFKIEFQGVQEIYNLACPNSPMKFNQNKIANILSNSYAVKNALDMALKYKSKFMQFSSSVVYGERFEDNKKTKEEENGVVDILSERASYDEGKRFAETIVKTYRDVYEVDAKIVRFFRIYGPRMPLDDGQMIPDFVSNALDNKDLIIYGDENFSSSFCYINDCLDAINKIMQSNVSGPINIGSDVDVKIIDIAKKVIEVTGSNSKIIHKPSLLFMSKLNIPDTTKARDLLGWMPLTSLEKGLEKTIIDLRASKRLKSLNINYL